ncbi:uncharacterized protein LOC110029347 [Phalaenopsis equestris]|uniref:uncharacterized protein LOC110029347 n=1 Tax=Phalaenopsis equestris TaxID=78828 RepID=UPI0009E5ACAA|nr:uncharacterized protein LOC110029347 [Phalaenopsis equestris]
MEKVPGACAMEWSIELEKGLRSKKPGHHIEAIQQIGRKLQQWSMEPNITMAISDVYCMIPGEDRLFANTIILRLANAFCNGDIEVRRCILKVFLVELQHITKKGKLYDGILARKRVPNYLELLKRLKSVYDAGDLEAKCLTLRLFGCWAGLAKDSSHICFLILTSMQSNHDSEVMASLFAAGCFSRLSEDFASITLNILTSIISSITRSPDVRLAAVRALARMQCSFAITNKAYQAGRRMLLDLPLDDIKAEMLSSLSKLASKTSLIFPDQLDLLQSFLNHEYPDPLKARALKCLYVLLGRSSYHFPLRKNVLSAIFSIFDDDEFSLDLQCLALHILWKIFSNRLLNLPITDIPDLFKLVAVVKNVDTPKKKRGFALNLLVNIVCSMKEGEKEHFASANLLSSIAQLRDNLPFVPLNSSGYSPALLMSDISFLIMDQVNFLVKEIICSCNNDLKCVENLKSGSESFELKKELKYLLNLMLRLVQEDPSSCLVAFSKLRSIVHSLVSLLDEGSGKTSTACEAVSQKEINGENDDIGFILLESDGEQITVISALILCFCRFANACLSILHETNSISSEMRHILKDVVNCIKQSGYSCYSSFELFCLRSHSFLFNYGSKEGEGNKLEGGDEICSPSSIFLLHQECLALDFTKKMLQRGYFWEVYRAGKYSCLQGLWFSATLSFRKLIDVVKHGRYFNWIKALMLYVGGESEIKLLIFPKVGFELINSFQFASDSDQPFSYGRGEADACVGDHYDWNAFRGNLSRVCSRIFSSEKALEVTADSNGSLFFQRFFLYVRGKFLELVLEILGLLSFNTLAKDKFENGTIFNPLRATEVMHDMHVLVCALNRASLKLNNLAKGYDLLATSFMDIDAVSFRGISRLGVVCSTLAFCTSFGTNVLISPAFRNIMSSSANNLKVFCNLNIVQDLVERLWDIDYTITRKLMHCISVKGKIKHGLCSRMNVHGSNLFDNDSLSLIQSSINGILCVQADLEVVKDVEILISTFLLGLQHLSSSIRKWTGMPLVTPKYFFNVRPCIGSELFLFHANSEHKDELLVRTGFQLPLNLCIQVKNATGMKCANIAKIYCVLAVRSSDRFTIGSKRRLDPAQCVVQDHKAEDMLWLSEILQLHLRAETDEIGNEHQDAVDNDSLITTFASFVPNKMGLGFSTCLLNVSHLPEGSYHIKWHSCCVDDRGFYWNLIPLNNESVFTVKKS